MRERELASEEWFDTEYAGEISSIDLPEPDEDYVFVAMRLFSFWPIVNSRGATFDREDFSADILETLIGKQVNLEHDGLEQVVGSVISYATTDDGVDIGVRIDREQAAHHGLDVKDMRGGYFSHCSLELTRDPANSQYIAYDDGFNIQKSIPVLTGRRMGIRRTTARDPYNFQGYKVAERLKPKRFTGVGLVPVPADSTAALYRVKASDGEDEEERIESLNHVDEDFIELLPEDMDAIVAFESEEAASEKPKALTPGKNHADPGYQPDRRPRYQLDSPEHVRSAAKFFGIASYRAKYTPAQRAHIDAKIAAAKKRFGIGDSEKAAALTLGENPTMSTEALDLLQEKVATLEAAVKSLTTDKETASAEASTAKTRVTELETRVQELETELASANETVRELREEKEKAAAEAKVDSLMTELHEIHPIADEERENLREQASHACDNDGVIRALRAERKVLAFEKEKETAQAEAAAAEAEKVKAKSKPAVVVTKEKEEASAEEFETEDDARQLVAPVTRVIGDKTVEYVPGLYI